MRILKVIEKSKTFWYVLSLSLVFFILRLPSLIEPNWYGDEGIYQVIGNALSEGRLLYTQIWDNKPPLLYMVYALFGGDQFMVRFFSLLIGLLSVWAFFGFAQLLFKNLKASFISSAFFAVLFSIPLMEGNIANAENFMLLPIIGAAYLVYKTTIENYPQKTKTFKLLSAGLLLGLAFLFKIVAVFDFLAFFVFLFITYLPGNISLIGGTRRRNNSLSSITNSTISFIRNDAIFLFCGFLTPVLLTILYFLSRNALSEFIKAAFLSNVGYVGYGNKFIIPQGFLILKLVLLALFCVFVIFKRKKLYAPTIFVILWFAFSLFNTYFSGRPYTHYTLTLLPSFCMMICAFLTSKSYKTQFLITIVLSGIVVNSTFKFNLKKTFKYYSNTTSFLLGQKDVTSYQIFFDQKTQRDYEVASFIKTHTDPQDNIFIWGDSAQIYALSKKLPPGKYTVAYHIRQYPNAINETQTALNNARPKYIILLPESKAFPFSSSNYNSSFVLRGASIYERRF